MDPLNLCQEFLAIIKIDGVKVCIYNVFIPMVGHSLRILPVMMS
jgi:hypothetical protein